MTRAKHHRRPRARTARSPPAPPSVDAQGKFPDADVDASTRDVTETLDMGAVDDINELIEDVPVGTPLSELHPALRSVHERLNAVIGLEHAVRVVLKEEVSPHTDLRLYESGILLCVCVFLQWGKQQGTLRAFLDHFSKTTAVKLVGFNARLMRFLNAIRTSAEYHYMPESLNRSILPDDAAPMWNAAPGRIVQAVERITITSSHETYACLIVKPTVRGPRIHITSIRESPTITLPLACGVCFELANPADACGVGECNYLTCARCRSQITHCPFCRAKWPSTSTAHL